MFEFLTAFHPDTMIECEFKNRTMVERLVDIIPIAELNRQFARIQLLRFTRAEIEKLRSEGTLTQLGLDALESFRLPPIYIKTDKQTGQY